MGSSESKETKETTIEYVYVNKESDKRIAVQAPSVQQTTREAEMALEFLRQKNDFAMVTYEKVAKLKVALLEGKLQDKEKFNTIIMEYKDQAHDLDKKLAVGQVILEQLIQKHKEAMQDWQDKEEDLKMELTVQKAVEGQVMKHSEEHIEFERMKMISQHKEELHNLEKKFKEETMQLQNEVARLKMLLEKETADKQNLSDMVTKQENVEMEKMRLVTKHKEATHKLEQQHKEETRVLAKEIDSLKNSLDTKKNEIEDKEKFSEVKMTQLKETMELKMELEKMKATLEQKDATHNLEKQIIKAKTNFR